VRALRDLRTLLAKNNLRDCADYIEDKSHPRLWRLLAESGLEKLDLGAAEKAYVRCSDYPGIQFVKRLRVLQDKGKRRAEVAARFARFEEAEGIYRGGDRADLAVELRMRTGEWGRVLELLAMGIAGGGDDELLRLARNRLGDQLADKAQWAQAIPLYAAAGNLEALAEAYYVRCRCFSLTPPPFFFFAVVVAFAAAWGAVRM
jgi:WD repeat-containing protein 35